MRVNVRGKVRATKGMVFWDELWWRCPDGSIQIEHVVSDLRGPHDTWGLNEPDARALYQELTK